MNKKGFSYAEAMITMLVVAIIMVASTPILSKKTTAARNSVIWHWTDNRISTFFGASPGEPNAQRVVIGSNSNDYATESARMLIYEAADSRAAKTTLAPILRFRNNTEEIGRLITTANSLGLGNNALNAALKASSVDNTAIGAGALINATGSDNTAIGFNACSTITDGISNICIGSGVTPAGNTSNSIYIGNLIQGTQNNITTLTETPATLGSLTINGTINATAFDGTVMNDLVQYIRNAASSSSDARLKNVKGVSKAGLEQINKLVVKNYTYKNDKKKIPHVGVIAQELQKIFPNSIIKDSNGYLRITTDEIFYAMVNAIKELDAKFTKNDTKTKEMEAQIKSLQEENARLSKKITEIEQKLEKK